MKIGIIGSSLSGLVAGKKLALAGHDVTVFEQNTVLGDRLATKVTEQGFFDYGIPSILPVSEEFKAFVEGLELKGVLDRWAAHFKYYDGAKLYDSNPGEDLNGGIHFTSKKGINELIKNIIRWIDIIAPVRVGGLTYLGDDRTKKRAWMINQTDINTFDCDAVIVATDAVNANAILQTTQNKTTARRVARYIDEIDYYPRYTLMFSANDEAPEWKGIHALNSNISWIGNDSSKSETQKGSLLTIQSSGVFAEAYKEANEEEVIFLLLKAASKILDAEIEPTESELHFWNFYEPKKVLDEYFMEVEIDGAPFALVGDYFNNFSLDSAYLSGLYLADYWINKFKNQEAVSVL